MHSNTSSPTRIALIGGGPAALFIAKRLVENNIKNCSVTIFEKTNLLGSGMPYSPSGAGLEHVTNISSIETPELKDSLTEYLSNLSDDTLGEFNLLREEISRYRVIPRLLFGRYLSTQFGKIINEGTSKGIEFDLRLESEVTDLEHSPNQNQITVVLSDSAKEHFDIVVICTGHLWPISYEGKITNYFDSPYPPNKLTNISDMTVAIRGSSLTAIDAIKTIARNNGHFIRITEDQLKYIPDPSKKNFKLVLHSREGFLPAVRFHLSDPTLSRKSLLSPDTLQMHRKNNDGFISLDYLYEKDFKEQFRQDEPDFYEFIKDMNLESFVETMMMERKKTDPFEYLKKEYEEARQSIRNKDSIYWKEKLTVLSIALNYPTKYFSAEDRLRLQKILMPLISLVIASVPQSSCEELIALHNIGLLELRAVGEGSKVIPQPQGGITYEYEEGGEDFDVFVDCIGQPHLSFEQFPFKSLAQSKAISPAYLRFRSSEEGERLLDENNIKKSDDGIYWLKVPGIAVDDHMRVIDETGVANGRLFSMSVPMMGGFNPDYSGLDFCEEASIKVVAKIKEMV